MSTLQQAAIIIQSLPRDQSARILSRLDGKDIKKVMGQLDKIDAISTNQIDHALEQLRWLTNDENEGVKPESNPGNIQSNDKQPGNIQPGNIQSATKQHEKSQDLYSTPIDLTNRFGFIAEALPSHRLQLLRDEHPRNISTVLAYLPPEIASSIMNQLDTELRISVLRRMCETDLPNKEETNQLVYALKLRYNKLVNQRFMKSGIEAAANVLSCSDPDTRLALLEEMRAEDPELAQRIKGTIFEFDDLVLLEDSQVKSLLRQTDTSLWAPALKHALLETRKKILSNMAAKPAAVLNREIASIGDVDDSVAKLARKQVVAQVLKMYTRLPEPLPEPITTFPEINTRR